MKKALLCCMTVIAITIWVASLYAAEGKADASKQAGSAVAYVNNKVCPVSGDPVDGKHFFEYSGKRYGLCCPMCAATFEKDPAKYSAIAEKEVSGK